MIFHQLQFLGVCWASLHVFLSKNAQIFNSHNIILIFLLVPRPGAYEPVIKKALLLSVTVATQTLCTGTYMKCICSGIVHQHSSYMCNLIVSDYSRRGGMVHLQKSCPILGFINHYILCAYICTCTDSQLTDQTSSVKPAAVSHKRSASQIDGSASKHPAIMSDNSQVSL